jgi:hypothetical protein
MESTGRGKKEEDWRMGKHNSDEKKGEGGR